jgi:hypothetical protein
MYFRVKCRATGLERLFFSTRCTLRFEASHCGQQGNNNKEQQQKASHKQRKQEEKQQQH